MSIGSIMLLAIVAVFVVGFAIVPVDEWFTKRRNRREAAERERIREERQRRREAFAALTNDDRKWLFHHNWEGPWRT